MRFRRGSSFLSWLLSFAIIFSSVLPVTVPVFASDGDDGVRLTAGEASAEEGTLPSREVVEISSAEDLIKLSKKSTAEVYSRGREFVVTRDIDLTGSDYTPISVMAGTFDGKGHTISGFSLSSDASEAGFIRAVAAGGTVRRLTVSGELSPRGTMKNIGGIAGINYGTIEDSVFRGYILAKEDAGGIVGRNMEDGIISGCVNKGIITATRRTGGIAGFNEGYLINCTNRGSVNAMSKSVHDLLEERDEALEVAGEEIEDENDNLDKLNFDNYDFKDDDLKKLFTDEHRVNYTGGITGVSRGYTTGCINKGDVGFDHVGYNTGGIVGYERGVIFDCTNRGTVKGRKNIGGIAGEFEPYVENVYHEDSIDRAQTEIGTLIDMTSSLNDKIGTEDDRTQFNIDAIRAGTDDLRARVKEWKQYYRCKDDGIERDFRERVDLIKELVDDLDFHVKDKNAKNAKKDLNENLEKLYQALETLRQIAQQIVSAAGPGHDIKEFAPVGNADLIAQMAPIIESMLKDTEVLLNFAEALGEEAKDFKEDLEDIRDKLDELDSYVYSVYDDYQNELRKTDDDLTMRIDNIADLMDVLADGLKGSDRVIRDQLDEMVDQMQLINSTIDDGFDEIDREFARLRDTENATEIFDDISDYNDVMPEKGNMMDCVNDGSIAGDINGGGIAGVVDIDDGIQSDFEVVSGGDVSLNYDRTQKATILRCTNYGVVTVKNNYAGGIAGRADVGAIIGCGNFAPVSTGEGDYAGGIAGKSGFVVRNNYSMGVIDGKDYVGGITGFGYELSGNYAMVTVDMEDGEKRGSIAGDFDEEGTVSQNYFVSSTPAVNGLTYAGQATELSYEELIAIPDIPKEFRSMKVTFVANGKVIAEKHVSYGSSIDPEDYPELPRSEDKFGVWENVDLGNIRQNVVVNAEYITWTTTIASAEPFPVLLFEGDFYRGTSLSFNRFPADGSVKLEGYEVLDEYTYSIESEYGVSATDFEARLLADDYKSYDTIAIRDGKSIRTVDCRRDGRYMVFPLKENEGFLVVRPRKATLIRVILTGVAAALLLFLLILIIAGIVKGAVKKKEE
ncbi:MAG: hypothetical protein K5985_04205 [Lachnospiraceae bacterium]|nr:hypothetical protein [Lachnospiraceae bacterium]